MLFLEHKKTYRLIKGEVPNGHYTIPIGKANVLKEGTQLSVVSYGLYVHWALEAARQLEQRRASRSKSSICARSARWTRRRFSTASRRRASCSIVHEDNKFGGIGAEISAMVAEEALFHLDAPIRRLCGPDVPAMGYALPLEEEFMSSPAEMADAMREMVKF